MTTTTPMDLASIQTCFLCKQEFSGPFALSLARKILDSSPASPRSSPAYLIALISYASELFKSGLYTQSERELRRAEQLGAPVACIESQLALCMAHTGRLVDAETLQRASLARARALHGDLDIATTGHMHNLASTLALMGRHAEAVDLLRLVYSTDMTQLGESHSSTLEAGASLGQALLRVKAYSEAVEVLGPVYARTRRVFGDDGSILVAATYASALYHADTAAALHEAETIQREVRASLARLGESTKEANLSLALTLCSQKRFSDAMSLIRGEHTAGSDFGSFTGLVARMRARAHPVGSQVTVTGLVSHPHLNGSRAVVVDFDGTAFRYSLRLPDAKLIRVRFECAFGVG
jgi:Flp pilus assembly protein TadD